MDILVPFFENVSAEKGYGFFQHDSAIANISSNSVTDVRNAISY